MRTKLFVVVLLVVVLTSIVLVAPVAAQEPGYVWPQPWQTDPSYNQGVVQAAQEQWGSMQTPAGQQWAAGQELYQVLAAEAAAAAQAASSPSAWGMYMVNPSMGNTMTYQPGGYTTTYWNWNTMSYQTYGAY